MKRLFHRSRGFTLVELMVVMTIMSIMAAIVVPAVTGTTTAGRGTSLTADVNTVQNAVERFVGDHPKGNNGGWPAYNGVLPTSDNGGPLVWGASFVDKADGITVKTFAPFTLAQGSPAPSPAAIAGSPYLRTALQHASATRSNLDKDSAGKYTGALTDGSHLITVTASNSAPNMTVAAGYSDPSATGWAVQDVTSGTTHYPVWRIDKTGKVYVTLNSSEY